MRGALSRGVWNQLDGLLVFGATGHLSDEELLGRFVARRDDAAEAAFAALVERHGPMVLGVCRRVLGDRHEAEDAFQATFLVLARKATSIARPEQLANWLFGVAHRIALDARARAGRRKARERRAHAISRSQNTPAGDDQPASDELRAILDEELARLPERYRGALVLCELNGLTRRAAARRARHPGGNALQPARPGQGLAAPSPGAPGVRPLGPRTGSGVGARSPGQDVRRPALARRFHDPGRDARRGGCRPGRGRLDLDRNSRSRSSQSHAARESHRKSYWGWPHWPSSPRASVAWRRALRRSLPREPTRASRTSVAVAQPPSTITTKPLVLPGSTRLRSRTARTASALDSLRPEWSNWPRSGIAPARPDNAEFRELRPGDSVSKGDLLAVFYSADVASKKNDLLDALVQLELDQKILDEARDQNRAAVPKCFMLHV